MSIPLNVNGAVFDYPVNLDENWGVNATGWAQAVTNGMLQMQGGSFPLTADVNFGPTFGLLSKYFETRSSNPATSGTVRLSSADAGVAFRNNANSGNLVLTTDSSDNLLYNGNIIGTSASSPLPVTRGGTGDSSLTAYAVLAGGTSSTSPVQSVASVGLAGQVLTSNGAGTLPTFQNTTGSGTVNSGTANQLAYYATSSATISGNPFILTNSFNQLLVTDGVAANPGYSFISDPDTGVLLFSPGRMFVVGEAQTMIDISQGIGVMFPNTAAVPTVSFPDGVASAPGLSFTADLNTGLYRPSSDDIAIVTNGVNRLEIDNTTITAALPLAMGAHKITGLANGSASTDAVAFGQVPIVSGTTNTIPKFTASTTLGNSNITDDGSIVHVPASFQASIGKSGGFGATNADVEIGTTNGGGTYGLGLAWSNSNSPKFFISLSPTLSTTSTSTVTLFPLTFDAATQLGRLIEMRVAGVDLTTTPAKIFSAVYMATFVYSAGAGVFQQIGTTQTIYSQSNLAAAPTFTFTPQAASTIINFTVTPGNTTQYKWQATAFIHETHNA